MKENKIVQISDRKKILLRPARFIGAIIPTITSSYIIENNKIIKKEIKYTPGLMKIIFEVLDNAIDEAIRTDFKFANKIEIETKDNKIIIKDNGRGIPVKPILKEDGTQGDILAPEGAWTKLNTGSNFDDEKDNKTLGQNGEGVSLTVVFSKYFCGETCDGEKYFTLIAKNNLENYETKIRKSKKNFTKVTFIPDYEKFQEKEWNKNYDDLLKFRLLILSLNYPKIKFYLNKERIFVPSFKKFIEMISENYVIEEIDNLQIAVLPNNSDDFNFIFFINGIDSFNGGKPLDWVTNNIVNSLKNKISKKYPNIKAGDIKNKLFIVSFFKNIYNPRFEDQIKSVCANTYSQFKSQIGEVNFEKIVNKIYKNKEIINPILETYKIKEEFQKRKELKKLTKKEVVFEKYLPSTSTKKYLAIVEGDSASIGLASELGRDGFSFFGLKGKPLNSYQVSQTKLLQNKELRELYEIIVNDPSEVYVIATDADLDGFAIRGLLIGFFRKYFPDLFKQRKIAFLQTPLIITLEKNKVKETFYSIDEYKDFIKKNGNNFSFKYLKGLGSWEDGMLEKVIEKDGLERLIDFLDYSEERDDKIIDAWLSKDKSDIRKEYILKNNFDLTKI